VEAATVTLVVFFGIAAVALAAGVMVVVARSAATAARALRVCLIASACAFVQVMAPMLAVLQVVVLAGAAAVAIEGLGERGGAPEKWWWRAGLCGLVGALGLLLVSTWARQYVWAGRELAPGSTFGTAAAVGTVVVEAYAPALIAGLLVVLVAAIAGSQRDVHRL